MRARLWPLVALAAATLTACGGDGDRALVAATKTTTTTTTAPARPAGETTTAQSPAPARQTLPAVPHGETLAARLTRRTQLRDAPGGTVLATLDTQTAFGSATTLAVVSGRDGWLEVLAAELPNGHTGWIPAASATLLRETWTIDVDVSARRLLLRHQGEVYARATVGVGAPGTDTPPGLYAVTDRLRPSPGIGYGCCILGLTGHQPDVPQGWEGGDHLALHGTSDPASIGQAMSHGCVRLGDADIRLLFARVPLGTQVRVSA